jgi:hypothetical protein
LELFSFVTNSLSNFGNAYSESFGEHSEKTDNLFFVDTTPTFLNAKEKPKPEWFIKDQLQLNAKVTKF